MSPFHAELRSYLSVSLLYKPCRHGDALGMDKSDKIAGAIARAASIVLGDYEAVSKDALTKGTLDRCRTVQAVQAGVVMAGASFAPYPLKLPARAGAVVFTVRKVAHVTWSTGAIVLREHDGLLVDPYSDLLAVLVIWAQDVIEMIHRTIDAAIRASRQMISIVKDGQAVSSITRLGGEFYNLSKGNVSAVSAGTLFLAGLGKSSLQALNQLLDFIRVSPTMTMFAPAIASGVGAAWFVNSVGRAAEKYYQHLIEA
jgi:hypothetical protein